MMSYRSLLAAARILDRPAFRAAFTVSAAAALAAAGSSAGVVGASAAGAGGRGGRTASTGSWKIVKAVPGANLPHFTAITATSRHGAWAFEATASSTGILRPAAWRRHGCRWTRASFPGKRGGQVVSADSTSPGDVWALLTSPEGSRVLRWNGRGWALTGRFGQPHRDVVALSRRDAWLFGKGAWHFDGRRWSHPRSGHGLLGGSALLRDSIWAFGATVVARWDGRTWARTSVSGLLPPKGQLNDPRLTSIFAQSARSVWAVGTTGQESQGGPVVLLHFNGHRWRRAALADVGAGFPGQVIPDGSGGLWIPFGFVFQPFTMLRYTGGELRRVALPAPPGTVLQVADADAVPGVPRAFAAGGVWPANGPIGGYTRAVILGYGRHIALQRCASDDHPLEMAP
jgi:hypothetical protein